MAGDVGCSVLESFYLSLKYISIDSTRAGGSRKPLFALIVMAKFLRWFQQHTRQQRQSNTLHSIEWRTRIPFSEWILYLRRSNQVINKQKYYYRSIERALSVLNKHINSNIILLIFQSVLKYERRTLSCLQSLNYGKKFLR